MSNSECPFCYDRGDKIRVGKRLECPKCNTNYPKEVETNPYEYSLNKGVSR